jgi:hypothetical protein
MSSSVSDLALARRLPHSTGRRASTVFPKHFVDASSGRAVGARDVSEKSYLYVLNVTVTYIYAAL